MELDVKALNDRLFERHMSVELTDAAKDLLAEKGFDPLLGARPLRRVIQRDIEDAISEEILMGKIRENEQIVVNAEGEGILGEFTFSSHPYEVGGPDGDGTDGDSAQAAEPLPVGAEVNSAPASSDSSFDSSDSAEATGQAASSESEPVSE